jgi:OOP family OmpA-OmpF porin
MASTNSSFLHILLFMKCTILIVATLFSFLAAQAQDEITAQGKVSDSRTGKGIKASIRYSSIPTGGISGRFNDSTFSFPIFGTAKYQITAEAKDYNPRTVIVDPKDIDAQKRVLRDISLTPSGQTMTLSSLIFPQGKSSIDPKSFGELDEVGQMMKENSKMVIQLEGHTDNQGSSKANMELSEARVEAVKKYLVTKGIGKDRIKTKAFGGTQPLKNEMTPEARKMNRRVEMRILKA